MFEMKKQSKEKDFLKWLITQIKQYGLCDKEQVVNSGAMLLDVSPVTTARYLKKLTSAQGEFKIIPLNARGQGFVATKDLPNSSVRDMVEFRLTVEELSEMQKSIASRK